MRRGRDAVLVGAMLVALGAFALVEGRRLYHLRETLVAGAVVGDDTFPMIVGAALVVIGAYLAIVAPPPAARVGFPIGIIRRQMLAGAALLVAYCVLVPWLGYTSGTILVSVALYRGMGRYTWLAALALGAVTTAVLCLLFRVWLLQPLPAGLLGG